MLCTIDDFYLADGTISGGWALSGLRLQTERIFDKAVPVPTDQTFGVLIVGQAYRIVNYRSPDDFTNVGGTNVTGNVFMATGTTPAVWVNESKLNQVGPVLLDRNHHRVNVSFSVSRVHASIKDAEDYILAHDELIPRTGNAKLIVSSDGITIGTPYALIINGALISHELVLQYGMFTQHAYNIVGAPLFPVVPGTDKMLLEDGFFILLETGDKILLE